MTPFRHHSTLAAAGSPVEIDGDFALARLGGVVRVFERDPDIDAWTEVAQLTGDGEANFGRAIAIHRRTVIVGAADSAYIFQRQNNGTWAQTLKLLAPAEDDTLGTFGAFVDVDDTHAIVSAPGPTGFNGAAYVFETANGRQVAKLAPVPPVGAISVGQVAVSSGTAFVLSPRPTSVLGFLFERNAGGHDNWGQVKQVSGIGPSLEGDVDISGDEAAIAGGELCVFFRLFERNLGGPGNWGEEANFCQFSGTGVRVQIAGDRLIIQVGLMTPGISSALVFARNQGGPNAWGLVSRFVPALPAARTTFFIAASLSGDTALIQSSSSVPGNSGLLVLVSDIDADGIRDGLDPCPRDPFNNTAGGCQRDSGAYPVLNDLLTLDDVTTDTRESEFIVFATFTNSSETPIRNPFFEVADLSGGNTLINADGIDRDIGATLSPDVGDGVLSPGERTTVRFSIRLTSFDPFSFFVNFRGTPTP